MEKREKKTFFESLQYLGQQGYEIMKSRLCDVQKMFAKICRQL